MEHDAADYLNIVMPLANRPDRSFAHHRVGLGQKRIKALSLCEPFAEFGGFAAELLIGERFNAVLKCIYLIQERLDFFNLLLAGISEQAVDKSHSFPP